jgi:hypothetical protein
MSAVWHNTAPAPLLSDLLFLCKRFIANGHEKPRVLAVVGKALRKDYSLLNLEYDPVALWQSNSWRVHQSV